MAAIRLRVNVWFRRRWATVLLSALVVGVVAGMAIGLVAGTRRTASAPDRYTEYMGGDPDLGILQQLGEPLDRSIAAIDGVSSVETLIFVPVFALSPSDGSVISEPDPFAGDALAVGGRLIEGRMPQTPDEFTSNRPVADFLSAQHGIELGDRLTVAAFTLDQVAGNFDPTDPPGAGTIETTFVGVTESPAEFDDQGLQMVFPRDFLDAHPDVGVVQTLVAAKLDGITADEVMEQVRSFPNGADAYAFASDRIISDSARRAVRFQATALWIVSALVALAAAVTVAVVISRVVRLDPGERETLAALGARNRDVAGERAVLAVAIAVTAAPIAVMITTVMSRWFPLGVLRTFEPDPGIRFDPVAVVLGVAALLALGAGIGFVVGHRRRVRRPGAGSTGTAASVYAAGWPIGVGVRFANNGPARRRVAHVAVLALGIGSIAGSVLVGSSVERIVDESARWGLNFQYLFGNPFAPAQNDMTGPIAADPDVAAVTAANIGSLTIEGSEVAAIGFRTVKGGLTPVVVSGRAPNARDEIGIGGEVARRLDVGIGDQVTVAGTSEASLDATIVGIVATPDSAGNGAAMTMDAFQELNPTATENLAFVNLRDGASSDVIDRISAAVYTPPGALNTPATIRALARVTAAPYVLGVVFALLLFVGGAALIAVSVRVHRRDLAVLQALGASRRRLHEVVHGQVSAVAIVGTLLGLPLGLVIGRWVVTLLADAIGVTPGAAHPAVVLVAIVAAILLAANVVAGVAARRSARVDAASLTAAE